MLAFKLAFRNLWGSGLRTWLNVFVLSLAFVLIIFMNGWLEGWNQQARNDTMEWEIGAGQIWHHTYDPYDPFTLNDAHAKIDDEKQKAIAENNLVPVLIAQATAYPQNRMQTLLLKGIEPQQKILKLPTAGLDSASKETLAIVGKATANMLKVKKGDLLLIRWRDKNGAFDATEIRIAEVFRCNVPSVDMGQIWISLDNLQKMTGLENQATLFVAGKNYTPSENAEWKFKDLNYLLRDLDTIIQSKKGGQSIMYIFLMAIALLAIFDTQVLAIFRRQKEIGTYIALGMTRSQVVGLFTVEGAAHSLFAIALGAVYGVPLLYYVAEFGIKLPVKTEEMGLPMAEVMYPTYGIGLIAGTMLLVIVSATIVSYLPARKISKLKPTEALKGKLQ